MRRIDFRVWDGVSMRRIQGLSFKATHKGGRTALRMKTIIHLPGDKQEAVGYPEGVLPILMQSTGLWGAEGVEIFEGDIVAYRQKQPSGKGYIMSSKPRVIEWRVGRAWNGFNIGKGKPDCYVVLGNIHENPELIPN